MTLGNKILNLRTAQGWSQEQLAEKINVNRQTISQWENDQSQPDIDKIVDLAQVFNVSTDYLLQKQVKLKKENIYLDSTIARRFISERKKAAPLVAVGVMLCIFSPILFLGTMGFNQLGVFHLSENSATAIGVISLLAMVAFAVSWFIIAKPHAEYHEELEKEECHLDPQLRHELTDARKKYQSTYTKMTIAGISLCILSAVPIICGAFFTDVMTGNQVDSLMMLLVSGTLFLIGVGVYCFIHTNIIKESYEVLLQDGDYTPARKAGRQILDRFSAAYWLTAALIYLCYSFITNNWEQSWVVWVIAGIFYAIIEVILSNRHKDLATE